jgi:Sulfite exporter TauE/SafE
VIACVIASKFLIGGERWVVGTELPDSAAMSGYGFVIGLASSLMGISGGSLLTMVLTRYGKPAHNAVATAAGIGVPVTLAGTIGYALAGLPHLILLPALSVGFVSVIGVVLIAPISSSVAPFDARLAHKATEAKTGNQLRLVPAACRRTFPVASHQLSEPVAMISNLNMLQIIGDLHRCENCLGFGQDRLSRVAPRDMCENKPLYVAGRRERCCLGRRQMAVAAGNCRILLKECRLYHKKIGVTH